MKKLFLASALALFGLVSAQTEKGAWVVSGKTGLGFNSISTTVKKAGNESTTGPKVNTFSIAPSVGYFVIPNLAVGLELNYMNVSTKYDNQESTNSTLGLLPNATYYFPTGSEFRPYLGAGVGYGSNKDNDNESVNGLLWGVKGGFVYFLNSNIGLDLGLGYNQFSNTQTISNVEYKTNVGTFGVNAGISIFLK